MEVQLNMEEKQVLNKMLDHYLGELRGEISNTDQRDFREDLKHEKEILEHFKKRLEDLI